MPLTDEVRPAGCLLDVVQLAVELLLPQEAAGVGVEQGVTDAAVEAVGVPGAARHLEDVAVGDDVAAEAALTGFGLEGEKS